jgi:hypothetical protein
MSRLATLPGAHRSLLCLSLANGRLLEKAELEFDVFLTGDLNLRFQQDVTAFKIAVVVSTPRAHNFNPHCR